MKLPQPRRFFAVLLTLVALVLIEQALVRGSTGSVVNQGPVVASKYGIREHTDSGHTYLAPMTQDEYVEALVRFHGMSRAEALNQAQYPYCDMPTSYSCKSHNGCKLCHMEQVQGYSYCTCAD